LMEGFKSGFIAIIGRPNVGKSTLLNNIVGEKVAILSEKPQTTRNQIRGVANGEGWQMIFIDTPGLHVPKNRLGNFMVESAKKALDGVDAVLVILDATKDFGTGDRVSLEAAAGAGVPVVAVLNKVDLVKKAILLDKINLLSKNQSIGEIIPVSALTGDGVQDLVQSLIQYLPEGPEYFPADMYTDQPEMFIAAEMIREKGLLLLRDEIPHGIGVEMLKIEEKPSGTVEIHANIICEKDSHKAIIIGRRGEMLKNLGTMARQDIQALLGAKVNLQLWVRVKPGWRDSTMLLKDLGYREEL